MLQRILEPLKTILIIASQLANYYAQNNAKNANEK